MKLVVYVLVILLMMFALGLLATAVGETPGAAPDFRIPACEQAKRARFEALRESRVGPPTADPRYHVEHYEIDIAVDFDSQTIAGDVSVAARSDRIGLEEIELDLHDNLTVSAVTRDGTPLAFTHGGHRLVVTLDRAFALSEPFTVRVVYDGPPAQDGLLSFTFDNHDGSPIAATVSEPWFARDWWPCRETPNAKSTASMTLTVPAGMTAVSNGRPVTTSRAGGTVAYRHESDYPIATYLVSAAITNFSAFSSTYTCLDGSQMPLEYYAYPEDAARAQAAWDIARPQMEYFRTLFGEYPFTDDRYGMVEIPFGGAMEHQTITSMGACCIESESTIAHELAHQWWGDYVTCATWHDIWLNEGFATWSAALWYGHTNPPDGYRQAMTNMDTGSFGSVYRYDISNPWLIFTGEAYRKGAWVLHMLRGVLGDEIFFDGLDLYRATHAYGNATTEDLEAAFETVAGTELDWFFDEWVYGVGRPVYEWGWEASGGEVFVMLRQVQSGPLFRMPVEIEISTDSGSTRHIVWNELTTQYYSLPASGEVTSVVLDPDDWLLDQQMLVTVAVPGDLPTAPGAGRAHIERITPIPFADTVEIRITGFAAPSASRARSRLDVYDARGRRVATLMDEALSTGSRAIVWDGMTSRNEPAASGVYFLRLEAPGGQETRRLVRTR